MHNISVQHQQSFCGLTKILQRNKPSYFGTFHAIRDANPQQMGALPKEWVRVICNISQSQEAKKGTITKLMENITKTIRGSIEQTNKYTNIYPHTSRIAAFFDEPLRALNIIKVAPEVQHTTVEQMQKVAKTLAKKLTKNFKEAGLINKKETVTVKFLNQTDDGYSYRIEFPERTGYPAKTLNVYKLRDVESAWLSGTLNCNTVNDVTQEVLATKKPSDFFASIKDRFLMK